MRRQSLKAAVLMVAVEAVLTGVNVMLKLAASDGMSLSVLVFYRFFFAALFISPVAFLLERNKRPKLTWMVLLLAFLCGLVGGPLGQNLYFESLVYTSATYVTAIFNLAPAFTFIIAVTLRVEELGLKTAAGRAKVLGTILCIGGAMLLTFYHGPKFTLWKPPIHLLRRHTPPPHAAAAAQSSNPLLGCVLAVLAVLLYSFMLILQAMAKKGYPCPYSFTALMIGMGSIQCLGYGLYRERDWNQWKLGWNVRLLAATFTGILGGGVVYGVSTWCVHARGPVYVAAFTPLWLLMMALAAFLFLDENIYLGTLLGAGLIIAGLYTILWGEDRKVKVGIGQSSQQPIDSHPQNTTKV
ncbi:hypothetical protein DM860_012917 [Cuscuta australis]|uniref:WAT1-related protein n=1 Tax=Cuscuta australis TaxID=267555 RepID=A0A328DUV6_9ASTE|nr:hypothetical protein DM860_012917 [Cuscuta australis]